MAGKAIHEPSAYRDLYPDNDFACGLLTICIIAYWVWFLMLDCVLQAERLYRNGEWKNNKLMIAKVCRLLAHVFSAVLIAFCAKWHVYWNSYVYWRLASIVMWIQKPKTWSKLGKVDTWSRIQDLVLTWYHSVPEARNRRGALMLEGGHWCFCTKL